MQLALKIDNNKKSYNLTFLQEHYGKARLMRLKMLSLIILC